MRDFRNAKAMAKTVRDQLAGRSVDITHSDSLELVAQVLGARNWQTLAAAIEAAGGSDPAVAAATAQPTAATLLPLIPMRDVVVFPDMTLPLFIGRARTLRAVERAMAGDRRVFLVTQRGQTVDTPTAGDLFDVGVAAAILEARRLPDGAMKLVVRAEQRARLGRLVEGDLLEAEVEVLEPAGPAPAPAGDDPAATREALQRFARFANFDPADPPIALARLVHMETYPGLLADAITPHVATRLDQAQQMLETVSPAARLRRLIALMDEVRPLAA